MFMCVYIYMYIYLYIYLSIYLSIYSFIYLFDITHKYTKGGVNHIKSFRSHARSWGMWKKWWIWEVCDYGTCTRCCPPRTVNL